jgi:Fur family peroxide stress response transcriptional regulator
MTLESVKDKITEAGLRASSARIYVLRYLLNKCNHPTVDTIYEDIKRDLPGLSKTSVYNSLKALTDAELVRVLTIEGSELRYDACMRNHGHFKCKGCGCVRDIDIDSLVSDLSISKLRDLERTKIDNLDLFIWGLCEECQ